jgi:hypothetical protein
MADTTLTDEIWSRMCGTSSDTDVLIRALRVDHSWLPPSGPMRDSVMQARAAIAEMDKVVGTAADSIEIFAQHGWAPSGQIPILVYERALAAYRHGGGDLDAAENILVEGWNAESVLQYMGPRMNVLGAADPALRAIGAGRAELVSKAWAHHVAGAYEASVPLVLAQIDGITFDVTAGLDGGRGSTFFNNSKVSVIDDRTVAGFGKSLAVARRWWNRPVDETMTGDQVSDATTSRHGVLHGRDLTYGTRIASTKSFVLLLAVWEWSNALFGEVAQSRKAERYEQHAGSAGVDENGWRLDRRGFVETRLALRGVLFSQKSHLDSHGRFASDLGALRNDIRAALMLDGPTAGISFILGDAADQWYAWNQSASGWVFAVAMNSNGWDGTYYWDGLGAPPPPGSAWRSTDDGNWSGDCHW